MSRFLPGLLFLLAPVIAIAQPYGAGTGACVIGGAPVLAPTAPGQPPSLLYYQQSFPGCTVTVYLAGTLTTATIYSNPGGTSLSNPFQANTQNGFWQFFAANNTYDVQLSGAGIPTPFTITNLIIGGSGGGGGGGGINQSASLTFTNVLDGTCQDQTFTFNGITTGTPLTLAAPSTLTAGLYAVTYAPATNLADVRLCNVSGGTLTFTGTFTAFTGVSGGGGGGGAVSSVNGDGALYTNTGSGAIGNVFLTLGMAGPYTFWSNNTNSTGVPGYHTIPAPAIAAIGTLTNNTSGNAGTVTNGLYSTGSYANPTWLTSLASSKLTGLAAAIGALGTLTNNTSGNAATATSATTASQVNGGAVPASQSCLGSNGSSQLIAGSCSGAGAQSTLQTTTPTSTSMVIGAGCSPANPCVVRSNGAVTTFTASGNVTLASASTGPFTIYAYVTTAGTLTVGYPGSGVTLSCTSGCTATSGITSIPVGAIPLSSTVAATNAFGTITDLRSFLSIDSYTASTGIVLTGAAISADPTVVSFIGTNCSASASPAVCAAAPNGAVAVPAGTNSTLVVDTSAVTANSEIQLQSDETLTAGAATCNTTLVTVALPVVVTARSPGTSFTITVVGTSSVNPVCVAYRIIN